MTIFGKPISSYLRFSGGLALLVVLVGVIRLVVSLNGVPDAQTRWLSMNVVLLVGIIYLGVRIHTSGFGSFKQLLPVVLIPNTAAHLVSITGIVIGIVTGQFNVFTSPEFAFGQDGRTWFHLGMHLGVGMTVGGLVNWGIASGALLITKLFSKGRASAASSATTGR